MAFDLNAGEDIYPPGVSGRAPASGRLPSFLMGGGAPVSSPVTRGGHQVNRPAFTAAERLRNVGAYGAGQGAPSWLRERKQSQQGQSMYPYLGGGRSIAEMEAFAREWGADPSAMQRSHENAILNQGVQGSSSGQTVLPGSQGQGYYQTVSPFSFSRGPGQEGYYDARYGAGLWGNFGWSPTQTRPGEMNRPWDYYQTPWWEIMYPDRGYTDGTWFER